MLCHGYCELGKQPLIEALLEIKSFLERQPSSVLTITFQADIDSRETMEVFSEAGLAKEMYAHTIDQEWPTLRALIEAEKRIVVFASLGAGEDPRYMDQWTHWIDNPYSALSTEDFACQPDRGDLSSASLYNLNHFITNPIALEALAEEANLRVVLDDHLSRCIDLWGRQPNQILVDFYSIGDALKVVNDLNQ